MIELDQVSVDELGGLQPAFVFRYSTVRIVVVVVFLGLFLILGLSMLVFSDAWVTRRNDANVVHLGGAIFVLFGSLGPVLGVLLQRGRSGIALTAQGVWIRGGFSSRRFAWDEIAGLRLFTVRGSRYLAIQTVRNSSVWNAPSVSLGLFGRRQSDLLLRALERYLRDPAARREIGTEAGLVALDTTGT